jgi:hypothetical protein
VSKQIQNAGKVTDRVRLSASLGRTGRALGLLALIACSSSSGNTETPVQTTTTTAGRSSAATSGSGAAQSVGAGRAGTPLTTAVAGSAGGKPTQAAPAASSGAGSAAPAAVGGAGQSAAASAQSGVGGVSPAADSGATSNGGSGGGPASAAAGSGGTPGVGGKLPAVMNTTGPGPYKTMQDLSSGPKGQSGVFRPVQLGENGVKHPIFVWGCGGGANPSSYAELLNQVASHGFVVIAEVESIGDNGAPLLAAADWMLAENGKADSPLYQKLEATKLGVGGHSIGSVNSFIAGPDPRWTTTVHVAGGSLDDVNDPNAATTGKGGKSLVHPTAYICSESDVFGNVEKTQKDYDNTTAPVFFTIIAGADHTGAARAGMPALIAWLRWHLAGEVERKSSFLDPQGEFSTGKFMSRSKNW